MNRIREIYHDTRNSVTEDRRAALGVIRARDLGRVEGLVAAAWAVGDVNDVREVLVLLAEAVGGRI